MGLVTVWGLQQYGACNSIGLGDTIKCLICMVARGGGGNAILGYFRPYLSRAIFGFLRCTLYMA